MCLLLLLLLLLLLGRCCWQHCVHPTEQNVKQRLRQL
jgi:hypothetical protein